MTAVYRKEQGPKERKTHNGKGITLERASQANPFIHIFCKHLPRKNENNH